MLSADLKSNAVEKTDLSKIQSLLARQVFDSRGYPMMEVEMCLESGVFGKAIVSAGVYEGVDVYQVLNALETRAYTDFAVRRVHDPESGPHPHIRSGIEANTFVSVLACNGIVSH